MKKTLFVLLAICGLAFTLTGCSSNSPKGVVKEYLEAVKKGDADKALEVTYLDEVMEELGYENLKELKKESPDEYREFVRDFKKGFKGTSKESKKLKYEILSEDIDGDEATVEVELKLKGETETVDIPVIKDSEGDWKVDPLAMIGF